MACGLYFKAPAVWGITAWHSVFSISLSDSPAQAKMIGVYLGLIPVVPLISAPFMVKLKDLDPAMTALLLIDL